MPDGKIIVAARVMTGNSGNVADVGIARLTASGALDPKFGGAGTGKRTFHLGATGLPGVEGYDHDDVVTCLVLTGGMAVVAGHSHDSLDDWDFAIHRLENSLVFADGFESGSSDLWSATTP